MIIIYCPITCLNTLFKIITSCISYRVEKFLTANQILTEQQKGCKKFSQGCKEQLTINTITCKQVQKKNRNLSTARIDYKKAYDSVPHSWLIEVLYLYKIDKCHKFPQTQYEKMVHKITFIPSKINF
jgi:hypothetical protein